MDEHIFATSDRRTRPLSRRRFLRSVAVLGGVAAGSLLAACQTAPPAAPTAAPSKAAESKPVDTMPAAPTAALVKPAEAKPTEAAKPAAQAAPAAAKPSGRLVYANPSKLRTLDTITQYGLQEFQIARQMMEPLLDLDQQGKLVPVLAESWTPSDGGRHTGAGTSAASVIAHHGAVLSATPPVGTGICRVDRRR